tara:strand:- start:164 stop:298 length:135 start_codon:yes stop_codon:yes gene_type:complete
MVEINILKNFKIMLDLYRFSFVYLGMIDGSWGLIAASEDDRPFG